MRFTNTENYITVTDLEETREQVKRTWKVTLIMLALSMRTRPQVEQLEIEEEDIPTPPSDKSESIGRALVIDSDPVTSRGVANLLKDAGFEVTTFPSLVQILNRLPEFSLVTLDERLEHLKDDCLNIREKSQTPIIILGSGSGAEAWEKALDYGADAYLNRSLSPKEIAARIKAVLRRY